MPGTPINFDRLAEDIGWAVDMDPFDLARLALAAKVLAESVHAFWHYENTPSEDAAAQDAMQDALAAWDDLVRKVGR